MGMSQDEIDKLMAGDKGKSNMDRDKLLNALMRTGNHFVKSVENIIPILVSVEGMNITAGGGSDGKLFDKVGSVSPDSVYFIFREPGLIDAPWIGCVGKQLALGISKQMMNQEDGEELTEALVSALVEGFNNVLGAFDTALKGDLGMLIEHADLKFLEGSMIDAISGETGIAQDAIVWMVPITASFADLTGEMGLIITGECLTELAGKFPGIEETMATQIPEEQKAAAQAPQPVVPEPADPRKAPVPVAAQAVASQISTAHFEELQPRQTSGAPKGIELILDVPLSVTVELGRKTLSVREILELNPGSLVELEKLAGEAVDLLVNGKLFARGEVVVIDENFGVRVSSIVTPKERLERLAP